jgi:hypothetical protein
MTRGLSAEAGVVSDLLTRLRLTYASGLNRCGGAVVRPQRLIFLSFSGLPFLYPPNHPQTAPMYSAKAAEAAELAPIERETVAVDYVGLVVPCGRP